MKKLLKSLAVRENGCTFAQSKTIETMTEEQYIKSNGGYRPSRPELHRNPSQMSARQWEKETESLRVELNESLQLRDRLRNEYREKVRTGEIKAQTRKDRLREIASGHPDNEAVKAAKRILKEER